VFALILMCVSQTGLELLKQQLTSGSTQIYASSEEQRRVLVPLDYRCSGYNLSDVELLLR
jgi:hypothetical protein